MNIYTNVEEALRDRKCRCGKTIEKGTKCFHISGYQSSQNLCPDCIDEIHSILILQEIK